MISNSLFDISKEIYNFLNELDEGAEDKSVIVEKLSMALMSKTDQVANYRASLVGYVDILESRINEIEDRKSEIERKIERFDDYVMTCMSVAQTDFFEGEYAKIKKRKPSQAVDIFDEKLIPIEYIKIPEIKPVIMKAEISKALKQGEVVEGARLMDGKVSLAYTIK
jgi:hypothetical protein